MSLSKLLVFGASGMLGQAVLRAAARRGIEALGGARSGTDLILDITNPRAVEDAITRVRPSVVINCAALTDLAACEADPGAAYRVNAGAVAAMASGANLARCRLIQISTDHFFAGDGVAKHAEDAPVTLVNEYARSKYAGEAFAATARDALILRTGVAGFRGWVGRPTFIEWAVKTIRAGTPVTLFDDFYTSTIDAATLADVILDLVGRPEVRGVLNTAAREVASKRTFLCRFARALGSSLDAAPIGSVRSLAPRRAESLGLDVGRTEALLGRPLPDLDEVIHSLIREYEAFYAL